MVLVVLPTRQVAASWAAPDTGKRWQAAVEAEPGSWTDADDTFDSDGSDTDAALVEG